MAPLVDPNLSHLESTYERDQQLQDLYVLALYFKLSKRKPTARQTERVKAKMAKEMYDFTERLYNPRQPNHEISLSGKKSFNEPVVGPRLSMISNEGQVLWECESSDPKIGSTLFVFKAEIGGQAIEVMFDSGASGNFIPKSVADKLKLPREACQAVKVTVASNTVVECTEQVTVPLQVGAYKARVPALVLPNNLDIDLILGTAWQNTLHKGRITLCSEDRTLSFGHKEKRHEILCLDPPLPPQADTMTYPVIKRGTAVEDIEFWLDPERKGWTEDDHRFMNDMIARGEDFPCFILNLNKENDLLTKT